MDLTPAEEQQIRRAARSPAGAEFTEERYAGEYLGPARAGERAYRSATDEGCVGIASGPGTADSTSAGSDSTSGDCDSGQDRRADPYSSAGPGRAESTASESIRALRLARTRERPVRVRFRPLRAFGPDRAGLYSRIRVNQCV